MSLMSLRRRWSSWVCTLVAAATLLLGSGVAFGRAPTLEELPTIQRIMDEAKREITAQEKAAKAAKKDPKMDEILAYQKGGVDIREVQPLVKILRDPAEAFKYRQAAAMAIRIRFQKVNTKDAKMRLLERNIGKAIVSLLGANRSQEREWADGILSQFWPFMARKIHFDPQKADYRKKIQAMREWKRFLSR